MKKILHRWFFMMVVALALLLQAAMAQGAPASADATQADADKTWFLSFVENKLSGPNRRISISNIDGILSSQASIGQITVADRQGIWLRINDARLDWNRLALLAGRISINSLSANRIEVLRRPVPDKGAPRPEAGGFSLPVLPVAVNIKSLHASQVLFGEQLFNVASVVSLDGRLTLADGSLDSRFDIKRLDGGGGTFKLLAGYDNDKQRLNLDLELSEPANGIAVNLLKINNRPPLALSLKGNGTMDNLDVNLVMAAADRSVLNGLFTLRGASDGRIFNLVMKGPVASLVPAVYRPFFGANTRLDAHGLLKAGGGLRLDKLMLDGAAVRVSAQAEIAPDGFLRLLNMDARIAGESGNALVLPVSGGKTSARSILFTLAYGMPGTNNWAGKFEADRLVTPTMHAASLSFDMGGPAENLDDPGARHVGVTIKGGLRGITSPRPEVSKALGSAVDLNLDTDWHAGSALMINRLDVNAGRLALLIKGQLENLLFQGNIALKADDLAPFSELAGRSLAGRTDLEAQGKIDLGTGSFDLDLDGVASGLHTGNEVADRLLANGLTLSGGIGRDHSGIQARSLRVSSKQARLTANGHLASESADMDMALALTDMALLDPRIAGPLMLNGAARGHNSLIAIALRGTIPQGKWQGHRLADTHMSFNGVIDRTSPITPYFSGNAQGMGLFGGEKLALAAAFHTDKNQTVLDNLDLAIGPATLSARISRAAGGLLDGKLHLAADDVKTLADLFFMKGRGAAHADVVLDARSGKQNATLDADINKLEIADVRIAALKMQAVVHDLFGLPQVDGTLAGSAIQAAGYDIQSVQAVSTLHGHSSQFSGEAHLADNTALAVAGTFSALAGDGWQLTLEKADLKHAIADIVLMKPAQIAHRLNGDVSIADLALAVGKGTLAVDGTVADTVNLNIHMTDMPLAVANLVRPALALDGTVSGSAAISGKRKAPSITFDAAGRGVAARILRQNNLAPLNLDARGITKGDVLDFNAHLFGGGVDIASNGQVFMQQQKLAVDVTLKDTPLSVLNGVIKGQNLGGIVNGSAHVSGAFSNPSIQFSVAGDALSATMLGGNGVASVQLNAAGAYDNRVLRLDSFALTGPQNLDLTASGRLPFSGHGLALELNGSAPLMLANPFLADRGSQLAGELTVHGSVSGSFQEPQLQGHFAVANGRFIDPELNARLNAVALAGRFEGERIILDRASANSASGGSLSMTGWISTSLPQGLPANLTLNLNHARYNDGSMLVATVHGKMTVAGALLRDPAIGGDILIEKAEITIPDNFAAAAVTNIRHKHVTPPIAKTLARAGMQEQSADSISKPPRLLVPRVNLLVKAPNRIFVRGRGLDVELGGQLRLLGPVNDIHPVGAFNMIRGRFDILAQRLTFSEGHVTMTGNLNPDLDFQASSDSNDIVVTVKVTGTPKDLKIDFSSQPALPKDEILARLIFKRSISELSPIQVAQLVDATAELTGITNRSFFGSLRAGSGLDKLDIITDAVGNAGVEAGRYIRDNVYLGVETAAGGASKGTVNMDISRNLKAKGSIGSDSNSNLGVFYERDY